MADIGLPPSTMPALTVASAVRSACNDIDDTSPAVPLQVNPAYTPILLPESPYASPGTPVSRQFGGAPYGSGMYATATNDTSVLPLYHTQQQQQHQYTSTIPNNSLYSANFARAHGGASDGGMPAMTTASGVDVYPEQAEKILRITEDDVLTGDIFYQYVGYHFWNAANVTAIINLVFYAVVTIVVAIILIGQVSVDMYWLRLWVILLALILPGINAFSLLYHLQRHKGASPQHIQSIVTPVILFAVGGITAGLLFNWYIASHGTTIHWKSASEMSSLTASLMWFVFIFIVAVPTYAAAFYAHRHPEHKKPRVAMHIGMKDSDVDAITTIRDAKIMLDESTRQIEHASYRGQ